MAIASFPRTTKMLTPTGFIAAAWDQWLTSMVLATNKAIAGNGLGVANIEAYGAVEGATDSSAAIQAAIDSHLPVYIPPKSYSFGTTTLNIYNQTVIIGCGYGVSVLNYAGTGSGIFLNNGPVIVGGFANISLQAFCVSCPVQANNNRGAAFEFWAAEAAFIHLDGVRGTGYFQFGLIVDQAICVYVKSCLWDQQGMGIIEDSPGNYHYVTPVGSNIWVCGGTERNPNGHPGTCNVITIQDCQMNGSFYGLVDDGGTNLNVIGSNNFNGNAISVWMNNRYGFCLDGFDMENAGGVIVGSTANIRFEDSSPFASAQGAGPILLKDTCHGGTIRNTVVTSAISAASGGVAMMAFAATTSAGALFHDGISVTNNEFYGALGRTSAIDVTQLANSFCGYNSDLANRAIFAVHYSGIHNDANGNDLLMPALPAFLGGPNYNIWVRTGISNQFSSPVYSSFRSAFASSVVAIVANVVTPPNEVFHVGAGLIKTITPPPNVVTTSITIIPDVAFTWDATGNIGLAGTAVIGKPVTFTWDGAKFYPSYV